MINPSNDPEREAIFQCDLPGHSDQRASAPVKETAMRPLASIFIAFASLLTAAAFASPASAAEFSFTYRTSELSSSRGVAALYERIDARAEARCARHSGAAALVFKRVVAACRDDVMSQLVSAIDHPALSAMHEDAHKERFTSIAY